MEEGTARNEAQLRELQNRLGDTFKVALPGRKIIMEGLLQKKGTEKKIKRTNERYCVLFSDGLLIAKPGMRISIANPS